MQKRIHKWYENKNSVHKLCKIFMKSYEVKILRHKILIEKKKKRHARTYTLVVKVTVVVCCFSASAQQHTHVGRFRTGRVPWFTQRKENEKNKVSIRWACTSACAGGAVRNRAPERQPTLARRTGFPINLPYEPQSSLEPS